MKKILFAISAVLLWFCFSCNSGTTASSSEKETNSQVQKNLDASHVVSKAFETGDASGVDSVIADDFVDHTDHGDVKGKDSLKAMINMVHTSFTDMKQETIKEIADNDYVFTWMRFTGTSNGAMGMPPGPYDMQAIEAVKCRDGKITEHWEFMDMRDFGKMMQQMQSMGKNKMDTTKMKK
ncbi:MAG TPA: ester cyclase [Chitinophagaceae bacterium]|jgi:predicted SnoaL-like aldol condensation-catalyzing enzyme|nr:ester cyclase [Chitinophagaceae bacterium]